MIPNDVKRLLDVGCSSGGFAAGMKANNPALEVWGVEPDAVAAKEAEGRLDHLVKGWFPDDVPETERFDCITFNDVLEHFENPWRILEVAKGFLTKNGTIAAAVPNIRHISALEPLLLRGRWDYTRTGILDRTHLRFFTRTSAISLFEESGFEVLQANPANLLKNKRGRVLALGGRRTIEFRALHYCILARPRR